MSRRERGASGSEFIEFLSLLGFGSDSGQPCFTATDGGGVKLRPPARFAD